MISSHSFLALVVLSAAAPSLGWDYYVNVGENGNSYHPSYVNARIGDVIKFKFFPKNHTVTQSSLNEPCKAADWGINSGFKFVSDASNPGWFEFEVREEKPLWFYCQQGTHCSKDGMVFAVNPGDKFTEFQNRAKSGQSNYGGNNSNGQQYGNNHQNGQYGNNNHQNGQYGDNNNQNGQYGNNDHQNGQYGDNNNQNGQYGNKDHQNGQYGDNNNQNGQYGNNNNQNGQYGDNNNQHGQYGNNGNNHGSYGSNDHYNQGQPKDWPVTVGANGKLEYSPSVLAPKAGDTVTFTFHPKNHTVTQSSFDNPCSALAGGFKSGFRPVPENTTDFTEKFTIKINDTNPIWVYCGQKVPVDHCQSGMVLGINPTAEKSFEKFKALAVANKTQSASSSTATASTGSVKAVGALGGDDDENSDSWSKWGPILIGLLSGNLLVTLVVAIFGVLSYIRRGGRQTNRSISPSYAPVQVRERDDGTFVVPYKDAETRYSEQ